MDIYGTLDFIDILSILSFLIGLMNLDLNIQQVNGVMEELQNNQNKMLRTIIDQNDYIIKQNEEILSLLKGK